MRLAHLSYATKYIPSLNVGEGCRNDGKDFLGFRQLSGLDIIAQVSLKHLWLG